MSSKQVGGLLGLGEARVLRLFSREVGKTLARHLLDVRMARAALLLKNPALPIKTVAFDCGYAGVSNFYRDFKRVYGTSPRKMRLMHMDVQLRHEKSVLTDESLYGYSGAEDDDLLDSRHFGWA